MPDEIKRSFAPIYSSACSCLILGSLPGDASLQQGHYYAHPRNAFWPILSHVVQQDLTTYLFEDRYRILLEHHIALWDVVHSATRAGSLDSALLDINANPLAELIGAMPALKLVIFNGQTAAKHGSKLIPGYIQQSIAPSSSPAHTLSLDKKIAAWLPLFSILKEA